MREIKSEFKTSIKWDLHLAVIFIFIARCNLSYSELSVILYIYGVTAPIS